MNWNEAARGFHAASLGSVPRVNELERVSVWVSRCLARLWLGPSPPPLWPSPTWLPFVAPTSLNKGRGSHWLCGSRWGGDVGGDTDGQRQVTWQLWVSKWVLSLSSWCGIMWGWWQWRWCGGSCGSWCGCGGSASCPSLAQMWAIAGELDGNSGCHTLVVVVAVNVVGLRRKETIHSKLPVLKYEQVTC